MLQKKILVCPLDWGLGHATRDIPVVRRLQEAGFEVLIAADGPGFDLLSEEFPELECIRFGSSVRIRYSIRFPAWFKITLLSPLLLYEIVAEHVRMNSLVHRVRPDLIISDNRYGLWNRGVKSVLITHQLSPRLPGFARFLEKPLWRFLRLPVNRFEVCWIPDLPGENNLSGDLSHRWKLTGNAVFTGPLSRFSPGRLAPGLSESKPIDLLIILSGPEPQRSQLQKIILRQIFLLKIRCVILQGLPGQKKRTDLTSTVSMYTHLGTAELRRLLESAGAVICRSGYSTIMELAGLRKKALLIPTPGQTEQEYLAAYLAGKNMFRQCSQYELDLEFAFEDLSSFEPDFSLLVGSGPGPDFSSGPEAGPSESKGDLLDNAINALV